MHFGQVLKKCPENLSCYNVFFALISTVRVNCTHTHQISANNSTPLCYSKINSYLGIIRGRISCQIRGYNSTRVIFESELSNSAFTIRASRLAEIFGSNRACIRASTKHKFGFSLSSFDSTKDTDF